MPLQRSKHESVGHADSVQCSAHMHRHGDSRLTGVVDKVEGQVASSVALDFRLASVEKNADGQGAAISWVSQHLGPSVHFQTEACLQ